jgi:hypothetical protein
VLAKIQGVVGLGLTAEFMCLLLGNSNILKRKINVELIRLAKHMKDEGYRRTYKFLFDEELDALGEPHEEEQLELISTIFS